MFDKLNIYLKYKNKYIDEIKKIFLVFMVLVGTSICAFLVLSVIFFNKVSYYNINIFDIKNLIKFFLSMLLILLFFYGFKLFFRYLSPYQSSYALYEEFKIKKDIENLKSAYDNLIFTYDDRKDIFDDIKNKLKNESIELMVAEIKEDIHKKLLLEVFEEKTDETKKRIDSERQNLAKRSNINLFIGMCMSVIGIVAIGLSVFTHQNFNNYMEFIYYAIPRLSLIILIELFAYFFLKLYKQGLDDIKYYQNELTNIEAKYLALHVAKQLNNHKLIATMLEELIKTERNFILEKDQTTIELEKERINANNSNNALQAVKDIFKSKN